jgi:type IV secretion system protein VirD4
MDGRSVLNFVDQILSDPAAVLEISSIDLLALVDDKQLLGFVDQALGEKPSAFELVSVVLGGLTGGSPKKHPFDILPSSQSMGQFLGQLGYEVKRAKYQNKRTAILSFLKAFTIRRPAVALNDRDRSLLRGMAAMLADGGLPLVEWASFFALFVWNDGKSQILAPRTSNKNQHAAEAQQFLANVCRQVLPSYEQAIARATGQLATYQASSTSFARDIGGSVSQGARWLGDSDVGSSRVYSFQRQASSLVLGYLGKPERPLYFNGNESLITIGGPGSGKTQGQVIPNLINYPGSAFVLDVKGELFEKTAVVRRRFGPVLRFAPTDLAGNTARYNPFDLISKDPRYAAVECQVLADELIPDSPGARSDGYWERKAREYVWAFAVAVAIDAEDQKRNLGELARYLSLPVRFEELDGKYMRSETRRTIERLKAIGKVADLPALDGVAQSIESGLTSNRLESVFDTARAHLNPIVQTPSAQAATASTDWTPAELRSKPGMTIYLCLKPGELSAFAPLVRLMFVQHVRSLTQDFAYRAGEPPVTFLLDEMPQLGAMPGLTSIIDIGRGAGVRLWMFAQYLGQIRAIYGPKADGLINACAVRCFMQPDLEAAEIITPQLGRRTHMFTGEFRPLAEPYDLMGRAFADRILALARGEHPANLAKRMAFSTQGADAAE